MAASPVADESDAAFYARELQPLEPALRRWLRKRFRNLFDVDDVVQESILRTLKARQQGKLTATSGFFWTVARNAAFTFFLRRKFIDDTPDYGNSRLNTFPDDADTVQTVCLQDKRRVVIHAISLLPDRCRQVVTFRLLQGMDYADIALRLGISGETARVQVARGIRKCEEILRDQGVVDEEAYE
jgi:RNA polymerase sigma factor (sigma-70 family)